jgi:O-antigen ligase
MLKSFWSSLHLGAWLLFAFLLPWQTKLIVRSAESNYLEIAIFVATIGFLLAAVIFFFLFKDRLKKPEKWFLVLGTVLLISSIVAGLFSLDPYLALYRSLLLLASLLSFYCLSHLSKEWQRQLLYVFLFSLAIQAVIGIFQFVTQSSFASTILGLAYHSASEAGISVIELSSGRWLRTYGTSDHPNVFGGLMTIAVLLSAHLWIKESRKIYQIISLSLFLLFFSALMISFSRAAYLAFSLSFLGLLIENRNYLRRFLFLIVSIILLSSLFFYQYSELLVSRVDGNRRLEQISLQERDEFNQRAWQNWQNNFLLGIGLSNSTLVDKKNDEALNIQKEVWNYQPAHNYWLLAALEGGIFFIFSLFLFWLFFYKKSRSHRVTAIFIAFFILSLFDHWLFSLPLSSFWFFFVLALI